MASSPHIGDIGVVITVVVRDEDGTLVDLSTALTKSFTVRDPSGASFTWAATFVTNGSDGELKYTTVADDLDIPGIWLMQVNLTFTTWAATSDPVSFQVVPNL